MNETKRERGRGRLYHQRGSAFWWMAFYKHGKQIRMSTEETDETKAGRVLKSKLQERDVELGGGRRMITPAQQRVRAFVPRSAPNRHPGNAALWHPRKHGAKDWRLENSVHDAAL